jgi:hypothetical protein
MEIQNIKFRAVIKFPTKEIHRRKSVVGKRNPKYSTVTKLSVDSLEDDTRQGRPADVIRNLIMQDRQQSVESSQEHIEMFKPIQKTSTRIL